MKTDKEWLDEWNKMHCDYVTKRNSGMADYCEKMIIEAKEAYYGDGETIMSDTQYDRFENNLKSLRPDSSVLEKVGS